LYGCETDSSLGERWQIGCYSSSRCPIKELTEDGIMYLGYYKRYKKGILPINGGWLDQTQTFVEAMDIISKEASAVEKQMQKDAEQRNK
jgi:hypothetical protein